MSIRKNKISNEQIAEYLILNPDFFDENPEVLNSLKIVHDSGAAVSLIEKQVEYLRSNYNSTTDKLLSLLENAKNNEDLFFFTQKLLLSLIDAENIKEIIKLIEKAFKKDFGAKESRLIFFSNTSTNIPKERTEDTDKALKVLGDKLKSKNLYCGGLDKKAKDFLFGKTSNLVEVALIPLKCKSVSGLIALGSEKEGKYNANKDSIFLDFIAKVTTKVIDKKNE